jgi:hypothetical protein
MYCTTNIVTIIKKDEMDRACTTKWKDKNAEKCIAKA